MKRVSKALVEKNIREIRLTNTSESSVVSSLSPHGQANNSLTSENKAKKISHDDQSHGAGGRPKGSSKAKKKQDKENKYKCIDSIVLEYSIKHKASKSVVGKVEYGYLKRLIDKRNKEFGITCRISTKSIMNRTHRGTLTSHLGPGPKSPLEEVELALVKICIQMGKIPQPLSCTAAIAPYE